MANIAVIGTGYVGLTTGAYLAHLGHHVVCGDVVAAKIDGLNAGVMPILEDGLEELVRAGVDGGRLRFVLGNAKAVTAAEAEFIFLCVPTPQSDDGSADLSYIESAAADIGPVLAAESVVINKSTVPVGSTLVVERALGRGDVAVVSNPEFLREGSAVHDCLHPDRIVIGSEDQAAAIRVASLFSDIKAPVIVTDPASAETIKYASNAFLATKISFVNAVANLCEAVGADVRDVVVGMGYDRRIGFEFLKPGPGWGGSCFVGDETLMVRHRDDRSARLVTFEELFEEVDRRGASGWEAVGWLPGEPSPDYFPVRAFTRRDYKGDLIDVRTKLGRRLTVTADHPFLTGDGRLPDPVGITTAAELTTNDWLPIAQDGPIWLEGDITAGSPLDALDAAGIDRSQVIARTVTNGTYVPAVVPMDEHFWRMIGLYLAEGHVSSDGARRRIMWSFHPTDEAELAEAVSEFWRELGVKVTERRLATAYQVSISSRILAAWFLDVLGLGATCFDKALPDIAWTLPDHAKRSLLAGLWDGDGSWSLVNGGPRVVLEFGTVSRKLADGMLRLLGDLRVAARLKVGRTAKSTVDTYWISISGADQVEDVAWLLPLEEQAVVRRSLGAQQKRIAPTGYRRLGKGVVWVRVVHTSRRPFSGPVFSLEVDQAETVVTTHGLIAHNCFPKDSRALVRIAEDNGYDFSLLKGVIEVNDEQFERMARKIEKMAGGSIEGKTVAVWGLTFKARTDDVRRSPSLEVIERLQARGAVIRAYDPAAKETPAGVERCADPYAACEGADVLTVLTEWDELRWVDFEKVAGLMNEARMVDCRNLIDPAAVRRKGFVYEGLGRP
jgi:UDPglucose 6-dehydrogenase